MTVAVLAASCLPQQVGPAATPSAVPPGGPAATATSLISPTSPGVTPTAVQPTRPPATGTPTITPTSPAAADCPVDALLPGLKVAVTRLSSQGESCILTIAPVQTAFQNTVLPGFELAYPRSWRLSIGGNFGETITFEAEYNNDGFTIHLTHVLTSLPLDQIERAIQDYEFVSLPIELDVGQPTGRQRITLGGRQAVLLTWNFQDYTYHQYFIPYATTADGQSAVLAFDIMVWKGQEDGFTRLLPDLEGMAASVKDAPPTTPVVTFPAGPHLPMAQVQLPGSVLVKVPDENIYTVYSPAGKALGQVPGLASANEVHVISPWTGDASQLMVLYSDQIPGRNESIYFAQGGRQAVKISTPWLAWVNGAPSEPVIAYTTIEQGATTFHLSLYAGRFDAFPMNPVIDQVFPFGESGLLYTYAIYTLGGQPAGLWLTNHSWGIGDFVLNLDSGLAYYDIASATMRQVLPDSMTMLGISPDYSHIAYRYHSSALTIQDLGTNSVVTIDLNAGSSDGVSYAQFSPDNLYLAWMEASGSPMDPISGTSTLHSRLRIKALADVTSARPLYDLVDSSFKDAVGFTPNWVVPVGWLADQTLLVEVSKFGTNDDVLVTMNIKDGSLKLFAPGHFADFVYAGTSQ